MQNSFHSVSKTNNQKLRIPFVEDQSCSICMQAGRYTTIPKCNIPTQFSVNVDCHDATWLSVYPLMSRGPVTWSSVYPFTHPELAGAFAMFRFQRARGTSDLPPLPVMVLIQLLPFFVLFVLLELKGHFHTSGRASRLSYYIRAKNNKFSVLPA